MVLASDAFAQVADALRSDLRTRFAGIHVDIARRGDSVTCLVSDDDPWGEAFILWDEDEELSEDETQRMFLDVMTRVADDLWPDEEMDPWPQCPIHADHPLQPGLSGGRAGWVCLRNPQTFVLLGQLQATLGR